MPVIMCDINLGTMQQTVYHITGSEARPVSNVPLDYLNEIIPSICYNLNTYNVRLRGNKEYINGLIEQIHNFEINLYGENKINIEVM